MHAKRLTESVIDTKIKNETIINESMRYEKQKKLTNRWKDDARQQQHSRDTLINNWQHSAR